MGIEVRPQGRVSVPMGGRETEPGSGKGSGESGDAEKDLEHVRAATTTSYLTPRQKER